MSRLSFAAILLACVLLGQTPGHAQQAASEAVNIVTVDGVKLKGLFYPSAGKSAPTIIMLHPIGEGKTMKAPEWKSLAESLQKAGYSVMMFDFRGHGDSTFVDDKFWTYKPNMANVKLKDPKMKEEIDVKDYIKQGKAYLPILVNDIAAVRSYLDRRNDNNKDCNTSSIIVIGADAGATLGALWINSEWYRYKYTPDPKFPPAIELKKAANYTDCAGNDIIGAVFLTIQPDLEKRPVSITKLLQSSCKVHGMAAAFFCGEKDEKAHGFAKTLEKDLKLKTKKHDYIGAVPLKTNLTGIKLLQKGLGTDKAIVDYLALFADDRKVEPSVRDFPNTNYRWKMPNGSLPAREKKGENNLLFMDYGTFLP